MSSENPTDVSAVSDTRAAVREKAQQVQAKQARMRLLRRSLLGLLGLVAVGAIAFGVYFAIDSSTNDQARYPVGLSDDGVKVTAVSAVEPEEEPDLVETTPEPAGEEGEGATAEAELNPDEGVVSIHVYVDYLAPGAGEFQRANARQLSRWITEGAVTVTYHPVALLTASTSGSKYSLRAAGAAACVATHSPPQFSAYNHELLVGQPEPGAEGPSDTELADLAIAVGSDKPKQVRACIEERHFVTWAREATARALNGPLPGTESLTLAAAPMIVVNGQAYVGRTDDPAEFSQFVLMVASQHYYANSDQNETDDDSGED